MPSPFLFEARPATKTGNITMSALDWKTMFSDLKRDTTLDEHGAYMTVAWVSRCLEMRCNALSAIPTVVYPGMTDEPIEWEFAEMLPRMLWLIEADLQLYGAAYWLRERNLVRDKGFRRLHPSTIKPIFNTITGQVIRFERRIAGRAEAITLSPEEVLYFWTPNLAGEVGPGKGWVSHVLTESDTSHNVNNFAAGFFERGAISATLLSVEGNPPDAELERLQVWWRRMLSGVRKAFETVAVRAIVKPIPVGSPPGDLAMSDLLFRMREQIATAAGVPQTMLEDAANYACLPGDQLVWTPSGPTPIARLERGDSIWQMTAYGIVQNTVEAIIRQPIQATIYEIKTPHRTLRASDNHPIMCVDVMAGRGPYQRQRAELVWKRADQIAEGDMIVTVEELPDQGVTSVNDTELSEEFMEIAGLYVGDGDGSERSGLRIAIPSGQLQDYYAAIAQRVLPASTTIGESGVGRNRDYGPVRARQGKYIFTVGSKRAYNLFRSLGLTGTARTKRVPDWVYTAALPLRLAFLRGYLDADGTVGKDGRLTFGACNKALIHDIRALCVSCGVPVSNVVSDVGRVGNYGPIELHRFICGYAKYNRAIGSHDERYIKRLAHEGNGSRDGRYVPGVTSGVWNLGLPSGLGVERVKSVVREPRREDVYDLCTSGSHTFIAEGVVVHNTAQEHHQTFYTETIVPEALWIGSDLNRQLFKPQGLRIVLDYQSLDIFQQDEATRAAALTQLVAAGVPLDIAMQMLGMELPGEMTYEELVTRKENDQLQRQQQLMASAPPREELRRWQSKALKALRAGKGAQVDFNTDDLTDEQQAVIRDRLAVAQDEEEVKAAFQPPFRCQREGYPYP